MPSRLLAAYAVRSRNQLVLGHSNLGELGTAIARAEESIRLVGAIEDPKPELAVAAYFSLGFAYLARGDSARAIAALEHPCRQSPYEDLPAPLDAPRSCLGRAYALAGRLDEAIPLLEEAAEPAQVGLMYQRPRNLTYLGEALLLGGRRADARSTVERALHLSRTHGQRGFEAEALRVLGEIHAQSEPAQADRTYHHAIAIATELEMRPVVALCHAGLARLHRGQPERARRNVRIALAMFREMDMPFWLATPAAANSLPSPVAART
jgi:tetratricopeptide (TPR) repeat protein